MHSIEALRVDPPANWQDFEHLCWLLWHDEWKDPGTQKNGRQGQVQHGVDVFGQQSPGQWVGVQCKGKDDYKRQQVTEQELRTEVERAKHFEPALTEFILATTAPRDTKIQKCARTISAAHQSTGEFAVRVCSWDDIRDLLGRHARVVSEFYSGAAFAKDAEAYTETFCRFMQTLTATQEEEFRKVIDAQTSTLVGEIRLMREPSTAGVAANALPDVAQEELEGATKRFKWIAPQRGAPQHSKPTTTAVLSPDRLKILGLIAVAPMPFTPANFNALFPEIGWSDQLRYLRRRSLITAKEGRLVVPSQIRRSFLKSDADRQPYLQQWIETLRPLSGHPDTALYLALQQLHSGLFVESVCTIIDSAECSFPGRWNRIYLSILLHVDKPKALKRFSDNQRARYFNSVALCLSRERRFDEAIRWFTRLRRFSKKISNNWGMGQSYYNGGITCIEMGELSKAETCLRKAARHARRTRNSFLLGRALYELGLAVVDRSVFEAADLFAQSEKIKRRINDRNGLMGVHHSYAVLAVKRGDYKEAIRRFKQSERAAHRSGDYHTQALERFNIGRACLDLQDYESALPHLRKARVMAEADEMIDVLVLAVGGEALALERLRKNSQAEKSFRRLFELQTQRGHMADAVVALHDVGALLIRQRKYVKGRNTLASAGKLALRHGVVDWLYRCHGDIGTAYIMEGQNAKAISALRRFARHAERRNLYGVAAKLWADAASTAIKCGGSNNATEDALKNALSAAIKAPDPVPLQLRIYGESHMWRWQKGDYDDALTALTELLGCARATNDRTGICAGHNQLGVCLQELGRPREALTEHRKALRIARQLNDAESLESSLNNLGEALRSIGKYAAAIPLLQEGESLARSRGATETAISIAHNRGLALQRQRKFDEAEAVYETCRDHSRRHGWRSEYVRALHALANLEWHRGNPAKATLAYSKALKAADEYRISDCRAGICLNYANALRWQQQTGRALAVLKSAEQQFQTEPDAHMYYSQLAALYDEVGDEISAGKHWELAFSSAKRVNNSLSIALSAAALAERNDEAGRLDRADKYYSAALEHESDQELRMTLLVQRLSVLLRMKREEEASVVFAEIETFSKNPKTADEYVDALLLVGDHNLIDGGLEEGLKAYVAALAASANCKKGRFLEIGAMIAARLTTMNGSSERPPIAQLERFVSQWLKREQSMRSSDVKVLLWPFQVAARTVGSLKRGDELNDEELGAILEAELSKCFEHIATPQTPFSSQTASPLSPIARPKESE